MSDIKTGRNLTENNIEEETPQFSSPKQVRGRNSMVRSETGSNLNKSNDVLKTSSSFINNNKMTKLTSKGLTNLKDIASEIGSDMLGPNVHPI